MVIEKCQENHDALVCEWIDILLKIYLEKYEAGQGFVIIEAPPTALAWWVCQDIDPKTKNYMIN
jgi:hypothetical protein